MRVAQHPYLHGPYVQQRAGAHPASSKQSEAPLAAVLFCAIPAVLTLVCALALSSGVSQSLPGLWFVYAASRQLAVAGVLFSLGLLVVEVVRHELSEKLSLMLATSIVGAMTVVWYASRLEQYFR